MYNNFVLNFSDPQNQSREENIKRDNALSLYDLFGPAYHKKPCPGSHESYNFGRPSQITCTIYLICLIYSHK